MCISLADRRSYIPKKDGSKRPLAVAALEDKIIQRAAAAVLSAIHEEDFLGQQIHDFQLERSIKLVRRFELDFLLEAPR